VTRRIQVLLVILLVAVFGMGFYALHLKHQAERIPVHPRDTRPITPPVAGATDRVTLFIANDLDGALHPRQESIALPADQGQRAQQILRTLISVYLEKNSPHPLGPGADVKNVFLVPPNLAIVDTNAAFADGHRSGILVEQLTLASIAHTLAANIPGVTRVKILVEGKERETLAGHADLADFYDTAAGDPFTIAQ
jgi:hypothetical protein